MRPRDRRSRSCSPPTAIWRNCAAVMLPFGRVWHTLGDPAGWEGWARSVQAPPYVYETESTHLTIFRISDLRQRLWLMVSGLLRRKNSAVKWHVHDVRSSHLRGIARIRRGCGFPPDIIVFRAGGSPVRRSWYVDESYIEVNGRWFYLRRAINRAGAHVDVMLSKTCDMTAVANFFRSAKSVTGVK
jgi:DDE domain